MNSENILPFLAKIKLGTISNAELRELIEFCSRIGVFYLNQKHQKLKKSFSASGITFFDVTVDSITPLFIKNSLFNMTGIQNSLSKWKKDISSNSDALFFLQKLITKRIDQTVNKILSEIDPVFGKILNNVMYYSKARGLKKTNYFGQAYLIESSADQIIGSVIKEDEFNNIPAEFFQYKTDRTINNLFNYINNNTHYFAAIPINTFVLKLKHLYINEFNNKQLTEENYESLFFINQIFEDAIVKLNVFIDENYTAKNKLSEADGVKFKMALKDISFDMRDGGINRGLIDYIQPYYDGRTFNSAKEKFYNILDYLYRLLKSDIRKSLEKSEFS